MAAIRFLTTLAKSVHSALFQDDAVLKQVRPSYTWTAHVEDVMGCFITPTCSVHGVLWCCGHATHVEQVTGCFVTLACSVHGC